MAVTGKGKQIAGKSPASVSSSGKRKKSVAEAEDPGARRKKKRPGVLQFFDDAAVDAESDYEDEELEMDGEDIEFDLMDHGKAEIKYPKGTGKSHLPFFLKEEELSGDELEELIKDRYGRDSEYVVYGEDSKECDEDSMKDPTIWKVKCMIGRERQIAFCLMQKYVDLQNFGTKLQIISAFSLEHIKGYIYIEADKACDVTEACKGFCSLYSSRMGIVSKNEIPQLFSVRNKACEVSKGTWVRMKSGNYKGDLAQVVAVDDERKRATVKLVPRIDLQAIAKKFGGGVSLKHAPVPAPRLISSHELEDFRPHIESRRDRQTGELFDVLDGLMLKDGYLYKKMSISSLIYWGVQPTTAELAKFMEANKDEPEDLNWISSIYDGRRKMRLAEASDGKLAAKQGNGFDLHDLVLYGQKAFGVIIAIEKDCFQILKGDVKGSEVVKVKAQEIKNGCIDKMFIAPDRHMKTISINDIVKVLEGPHQGKQGIVRHMYKGSLFIYDENQQENSGFLCAKSELCENIKDSKDSYGANLSGKSCPMFTQSPSRSCEQQNFTRGSSSHRPSVREQTFCIGQTLRVRKGPLKGYLCRVVGIFRSDVTVKLDSLVKVMTVKEDLLSVPNLRRDDSTAMPSDLSGTQEWQPIGVLSDEGRGATMDKSSWDVEVPLSGRNSWQPLSTSAIAGDNDNKADKEQGADPWGSKATFGARDPEQNNDPWGSNAAFGAKDQEQGTDPWGSKATVGAKDDSCSKKDMDGWAKASTSTGEQNSIWNKTTAGEKVTDSVKNGNWEKDAGGWNTASVKSSKGTDGWDKADVPSVDAGGIWGKESNKNSDQVRPSDNATVGWDRPRADDSLKNMSGGSSWEKAATSKGKGPSSWTRPEVTSSDKGNAWDLKGKSVIRDDGDAWGKPAESKENTAKESDAWGKSSDLTGTNQADGWDTPAVRRTQSAAENAGQGSSWDKVKVPSGDHTDNWGKAKDGCDAGTGGWNKAGSSKPSQADEWNKPNSFGGNAVSGWNKVDNADAGVNDQRDTWDKPRNFERGREFGRGRGGGRDGGRGRGWGRGRDGNDDAGDQENSWNQQRDFDGGRGSSWGRGRGRYGGRGSRDQDDGGRGSSWGSGRGGGRGRNGDSWGQRDDSDETKSFGRGRGRGFGRGRFQSSDWKNDQENSVDRSFSRNPVSSWGGDQSGGWEKSKGFGKNEESAGNIDQQGGWNRGKSSNWNKDEGSNTWSAQKASGGNQPSSWNQGSTVKDDAGAENNWNKANPAANTRSSGWSKNEGDNWGAPKGSGSSQFSGWDNKSSGNEDAGKMAGGVGGSWDSAKPNEKQSSGWTVNRSAGNEVGKEAAGVGGSWDSPKPTGEKTGTLSGGAGDKWDKAKPSDGEKSSGWNSNNEKNSSMSKELTGDLYSGSAAGESSEWEVAKTPGASNEGKDWNTPKASGSNQSSVWARDSHGETGDAGGSWDKPKFSGAKQSSDWNNSEKGNWNTPTPEVGNESGDAAARGDNWNKAKTSSGANWNASKAFDGNKSSEWGKNSSASEAGNEGDNSGGNWAKPKTYPGGSQSSGWKNDDGNGWNKPKPFGGDQSTAWNDRSGGYQGRGGDRSEGWNRGGNFGGDQQSGWRGNSSSRGRGRGRNFGGGRSSGWNGGGNDGGDQADTFNGRKEFGRGRGGFTGRGGGGRGGYGSWREEDQPSEPYKGPGGGNTDRTGGWNAGGNADKGSWGGPKSEAGKQASGWTQQSTGGSDNWDRPKGGIGSSRGAVWNTGSGSASAPTEGEEGGWNQKKAAEGADSSNVWSQGKTTEGGRGQQEETWSRGGSSKGEDASGRNQKGAGWNAGSASSNETTVGQAVGWNPRRGSDGAGSSGGWNSSTVSDEKISSKAEEASDGGGDKGSSWEKVGDGGWGKAKDGSGGKGGGGW